MGYDMSIRNYSGPGTVESENGNTDGDYFRLNIWGMSTMRPIMAVADVLDTVTPDPSWPSYPGDEHFDDDNEPVDEIGHHYKDRCEAARSESGIDGKVPIYKFGSNDGWLVTPDECRLIAEQLPRVDDASVRAAIENENDYTRRIFKQEVPPTSDEDVAHWRKEINDFAAFCARAAESGEGFEVW